MKAYAALRPRVQAISEERVNYEIKEKEHAPRVEMTTEYLELGDGRKVHHAEDLLPVVAFDSSTAREATSSGSSRIAQGFTMVLGIAAVAAGAALIAVPLTQRKGDEPVALTPVEVGVALLPLGAGLFGWSFSLGADARRARERAFSYYEADLREKLNLCHDKQRGLSTCQVRAPVTE